MSPSFQLLEPRRLLAAAAAYVVGTTLFADGTDGNDTIAIYTDGAQFDAEINSASFGPFFSVNSIVLRGFGGNDRLDASNLQSGVDTFPASLDGGAGNDTITAHWYDTISGGAGDDTFNVTFFENEYGNVPVTIDGDAGRDTLIDSDQFGGDVIDLRQMPTVENAQVPGGTVYGNSLNNKITITNPDYYGPAAAVVYAGAGNDTILGGETTDTILGEAGNDSILGNGGDDSLDGGTGADTIKGGAGRDIVEYGSRKANLNISLDTLSNDGEANEKDNVWNDIEVLHSGSGNDLIRGSSNAERLAGNGGNDTIFGSGGGDTLVGGEGNDSLLGEDGGDTLLGNAGNDTLDGGAGSDTLDGGAGNNTLRNGETITTSLYASLANRVLTINGSADDDVFNIQNVDGKVTIFGKNYATSSFDYVLLKLYDGSDFAELSGVNVSVVGGNGNDTIFMHAGTTLKGFDGGSGTDMIKSDTGQSIDLRLYPTVENVYLRDGTTASVIGNALANDLEIFNISATVQGLGGNDTIHGGTAGGVLDGGEGDDYLWGQYTDFFTYLGGNGNDRITEFGDAGDLHGGPGNDTLTGGLESDTLDGGTGSDLIDGGENDYDQADTIDYSSRTKGVSVTLDGIANDGEPGEKDNVKGVQIFLGGSGDDVLDATNVYTVDYGVTLIGGAGNDRLIAASFDEYYNYSNILQGGAGNDTLLGGSSDDRLDGGPGADLMKGGGGFDIVDYSARKNNLTVGIGTAADDGEANEHDNVWLDVEEVIGGSGNDKITSNASDCVLLGLAGNDTLIGGAGVDALHGGSGNDQLFGNANFDFLDGGPGADTLNGGAGIDQAVQDPSDILISIEAFA